MTKAAGDWKTIGKHMRLPRWVVDVIESRGLREKRTFSVQLCFELEQLPHFRAAKPRPGVKSKVDVRVKPSRPKPRPEPKRKRPFWPRPLGDQDDDQDDQKTEQ